MNTPQVDEAMVWMRDQVDAWLASDDSGHERLIRWLESVGLPDPHDDAFVWLLRGIRLGHMRYGTVVRVAERLADLSDERPDQHPRGDRPEEVLYNLLNLCAELDCPDQLARPLLAMRQRRALRGDWLGTDLRGVLLRALIHNQKDADLLPLWRSLLAGTPDPFLGGTRFDGFHGILRTPSAGRGEPDLEKIGDALRAMAEYLTDDRYRRQKFDGMLGSLTAIYPRSGWDRLLLETAAEHDWPVWAGERLPRLCLEIGLGKESGTWLCYLPHSIAYVVHEIYGVNIDSLLLRGRVRRVSLPAEARPLLTSLIPELEGNRLGDPWGTEGSVTEVDDYTLQLMESRFRSVDRHLAAGIRRARARLLAEKKVGFSRALVELAA